ncbi:thioredoxin family protein [Lentisphaerota bacterium WC36G]|nr:thioredoxin family protein [Lentisphaerae bacterium WC36]
MKNKHLFLSTLMGLGIISSTNLFAENKNEKKDNVSKRAVTMEEANSQKSQLWFQNIDKDAIYNIAVKLVNDKVFTDNIDEAIARSRKENKPLLIEFVGSNWCPACMVLIKDVFTTKKFQAYAKENLVLMLVDLPRDVKIEDKLKEQNMALSEIFKVSGWPTGIMLEPSLKKKLYGYTGGIESTDSYIDQLSTGVDAFYDAFWQRDLEIATKMAKENKNLVLVEFVVNQSKKTNNVAIKEDHATPEFEKNIFSKNKFKQYVKKNLVLTRLNIKNDAKLAEKYNITKPSLLVLDLNGKVVKNFNAEEVKNIDIFLKKITAK